MVTELQKALYGRLFQLEENLMQYIKDFIRFEGIKEQGANHNSKIEEAENQISVLRHKRRYHQK